MKYKNFILFFIFSLSLQLTAQDAKRSKIIFSEKQKGFYEEMSKEIDIYNNPASESKKSMKADLSEYDLPTSTDQFTKFWHIEPISQGMTGCCWCFSTTSFFESEIYRLHNRKVKLSEMFTVYWEYVEKAKRFVEQRGNSNFAEGSEGNAVRRIWKRYGIVPAEAYTGLKKGQKFHDHGKMFNEMNEYLQTVKKGNAWNEETVLSNIKSILNYWLGTPPSEVTVENKKMTPLEYLAGLKLNLDDYYDIISLMEKPYYQKMVYDVPDNWWLDGEYYNVPLDEYMNIVKNAIRKNYTMSIGGDVSEPGYDSFKDAAIVPSFDIPSEYIDENARQFRFTNGTTTDDHGIHLVGYLTKDGKDWYLIKDSGAGGRNGNAIGYYFYHEDYMKLKIIDFMVHKDIISDILKKF